MTINNTYLQELQFGSYSEAVINLTCEVTDKTGKVSKYEQQANAKYMQKGDDVKQKITSRGDSVVYIYTPYLIYKYATNMPDFEILDSVVYNDGKDNIDLIKEAEKISLAVIEENIKPNYVDFNKIKNGVRDKLGKYLYQATECKPMILIVIQEV